MTQILAGFECGRLGWNGHDLLHTTGHVPEARMAAHYALARQQGLTRARDGLPWRHDPAPRIAAARDAGADVIWDLSHFDPPEDPVGHARRAALAADPGASLWLCPVNEPSIYPWLCGMPREEAARLAITMCRVAKDHHPDVRVLTTDPITGIAITIAGIRAGARATGFATCSGRWRVRRQPGPSSPVCAGIRSSTRRHGTDRGRGIAGRTG